MRSICFVNKFEFNYHGKVLQDAICLGDIDNDGESELVIGNTSGDLAVFKGEKLWQSINGLGMIASVAVGDVMNCGSNAVVTVSVEGWCHIYLCLNSTKSDDSGEKLVLVHKQRVPPNTKVLILGDVQGEGQIDMILGLTDRVIRIYRWLQTPAQVNLVCLNKCESASQIGSICLAKNEEGKPCILVSQPNATYMKITYRGENGACVDYHEVTPSKHSVSHLSSQIIGNVQGNGTVLASIDGNVLLVKDHQPVWSINVDQQAFVMNRINVCKDGSEQIVVASWSGHTFIIDYHGNAVCFELGTPIQTFTSGLYSSKGTATFIYVTFDDKILVYHDIFVDSLVLYSFYALQSKDPKLSSLSKPMLKELTKYCLYHVKDD